MAAAHGADAPYGTYGHDYLGEDLRCRLNEDASRAFNAWQAQTADALTIDRICLSWVWELQLYASVFLRILRDAVAFRRALDEHRPGAVQLQGVDPSVAQALGIVARQLDIRVDATPALKQPRARRLLGDRGGLGLFGAPSAMRSGTVLVAGYWSLTPLIDKMLRGDHIRAACHLEMRPPGPLRTVRMATSGGWVGVPSRRRVSHARGRRDELLARLPEVDLAAAGSNLGPAVHSSVTSLIRSRGALDLARVEMLKRAFRRSHPSLVLLPYDSTPETRLLVAVARCFNVPTLCVAHGGYWIPSPVMDLEASDHVAVWSSQPVGLFKPQRRPVHVVGYPKQERRATRTKRNQTSSTPRVAVLEQVPSPRDARIDARITMRHYLTALGAVRLSAPYAQVILRPHPSADLSAVETASRRYSDLAIAADVESEILELLASCDVCIGSLSTATLEASVAGTPVVALNVTGVDWPAPLGGDTAVPIARSTEELAAWLSRVFAGESLPGQDALHTALGANRSNPAEKMLQVVADVLGASATQEQLPSNVREARNG